MMGTDPATAAIEYALDPKTECPMDFLRCWFHGDFDVIRREWPEAPRAVFIGADPTMTPNTGVKRPAGREDL